MFHDNGRSSTESTRSAETCCGRTDQHINLRGRDIVKLGETTTGSPNSSEREGFVENEAILIFVFEFNLRVFEVSFVWLLLINDIGCTNLGKSAIEPSRSKIPSVMMNRRVSGARRFLVSLLTLSKTSSKLFMSLWSNQRMVLREIWSPF